MYDFDSFSSCSSVGGHIQLSRLSKNADIIQAWKVSCSIRIKSLCSSLPRCLKVLKKNGKGGKDRIENPDKALTISSCITKHEDFLFCKTWRIYSASTLCQTTVSQTQVISVSTLNFMPIWSFREFGFYI